MAHQNKGGVYELTGKYELAIKNYAKIIEINPNYVKAYQGRIRSNLALGREDLITSDKAKLQRLTGQ